MKLGNCLYGQMFSPFCANFILANVEMSKIKLGKIFLANVQGQMSFAQRTINPKLLAEIVQSEKKTKNSPQKSEK